MDQYCCLRTLVEYFNKYELIAVEWRDAVYQFHLEREKNDLFIIFGKFFNYANRTFKCKSAIRSLSTYPIHKMELLQSGHDVKLHPHFHCHWQLFVLMAGDDDETGQSAFLHSHLSTNLDHIGSAKSSIAKLFSGVIQGSGVGPLLFLTRNCLRMMLKSTRNLLISEMLKVTTCTWGRAVAVKNCCK